jgi:hypothetical protein
MFSAAAIISRVISPSLGVAVRVGDGVTVGVGVLYGGRGVLFGSRLELDEQACESTDEMPSVDKSCRNPLRSSMLCFSLRLFTSILSPIDI